MKLILQEFYSAIREKVLSKKWFKILAIVLVFSIVTMIVKVAFFPSVEVGVIGGKDSKEWDTITDSYDSLKDGEINTTPIDPSKMETAINFFFLAANEGDMNRFSSVISADTLEKDFTSKFELSERLNKYNEAMSRISRNGKISKVEIIRGFRIIGSKTNRIVLDLHYEDLPSPIRVNMVVKAIEEVHTEHSYNEENGEDDTIEYHQPFITTSVWDLIDSIEGK